MSAKHNKFMTSLMNYQNQFNMLLWMDWWSARWRWDTSK